MRKNFLNQNFIFIDRKKGFHPCCNRNLSAKNFFDAFLMSGKFFSLPPGSPTFSGKIGPPKQTFAPGPRISLIGPAAKSRVQLEGERIIGLWFDLFVDGFRTYPSLV
jgi:hypothetical protein